MKVTLSEFKKDQLKQVLKDMDDLKKRGEDNTDIFNTFLEEFKSFVGNNFGNFKVYGGHREALTEAYKKRKKKMGYSGIRDLNLGGALKEAATGGEGFYQIINKDEITWGIDKSIIPYAGAQQFGNKFTKTKGYIMTGIYSHKFSKKKYENHGLPAAPYFGTVKGDLPGKLQQRFIDLIRKKLSASLAFRGK